MSIKENSYFAGGVKSLGFNQQGQDVSVGVMLPGEYTFGHSSARAHERCQRCIDRKESRRR